MSTTLRLDTSPAAWIRQDPQPWNRLVTLGPTGLPAYARLRFLPDPTHPGRSEDDAPEPTVQTCETEQLHRVLDALTSFTTTPQQCFFLLWDGWGTAALDQVSTDRAGTGEGVHRQQPPPHLRAPLVRLPHRDHHLFQGTVEDLGDWGPALPLRPCETAPVPAFVWPADHAWCLTRDVDPHYAGIGAPSAAVDALLQARDLDVVPADPAQQQPYYL